MWTDFFFNAKSVSVPRHIDFYFPDFTASQEKLVKMSVLKISVQLGKTLRKTEIKFDLKDER